MPEKHTFLPRKKFFFSPADYGQEGYCFQHYLPSGKVFAGRVVLIHGWGVRCSAMESMGYFLCRHGFEVFNYDYPTSEQHIAEHGKRFLAVLRREKVLQEEPYCVLTHSMGGLVLRWAMSEMSGSELRNMTSIVMLGPPHGGSLLAFAGKIPLLGTWNRSLGDMVPFSKALQIPQAAFLPPVGIIAGAFDEKVSLKNTALPDGLPFERIIVKCTHPMLRDPVRTGRKIVSFFRNQHF